MSSKFKKVPRIHRNFFLFYLLDFLAVDFVVLALDLVVLLAEVLAVLVLVFAVDFYDEGFFVPAFLFDIYGEHVFAVFLCVYVVEYGFASRVIQS